MSGLTRSRRSIGFTIIELLVVISIIALLIGILLPAISRAREGAKVTQSSGHLKNLGAAHQVYAAEWNDRQFTLVRDDISTFTGSIMGYQPATGQFHPPIILGWSETGALWGFWYTNLPTNAGLIYPINPATRTGWFRIPNARQFNQYVNGRFYDPIFYAPKDKIVIEAVGGAFDHPAEFSIIPGATGTGVMWSSYCLSPAGLFSPKVLSAVDGDPNHSWTDPLSLGGGFRCPSMSQSRFPSLKTHMLEHNWLQGARGISCNPAFAGGTYLGCEPFFFNHAFESAPVTLFFDGSVRTMGTREATAGDSQARGMSNPTGAGLYLRPGQMPGANLLNSDGYYLGAGYDFSTGSGSQGAQTGYHILTRDGILGRDTLGSN